MNLNKIFLYSLIAIGVSSAFFLTNAVSSVEENDTVILTSNNTLNLNDEVNGDSVATVQAAVRGSKGKGPLYLFLNTPGGSIQAGLELIEAMRGIERPVNTITLFAASMGFQIVQHLGERLIVKNGTLMSHRAYGGFEGEFGGTSPNQIESRYGFWKKRIDEMDQQTVARTNGKQTMETYLKAYSPELWMTGTEAVNRGYADRIVTVKCDSSLEGTTKHTVEFLGLEITYELDKCPLNTAPLNIKAKIPTTFGMMYYDEFLSKGGSFDAVCLTDVNKLCSLDTSLNITKLNQIKRSFSDKFTNKFNKTIPMVY